MRSCSLCMESDHRQEDCSLQLATHTPKKVEVSAAAQGRQRFICFSWNDGRCFHPACRYRHACAAELIMKRGRGALLSKTDIESAYRNVPVYPEDRFLLGMRWKGLLYIDTCLPFGLRSAIKIFTALADALCWIVTQHGVRDVIHYLDDYLVMGDPGSSECEVTSNVSLQLCERLGVPIAEKKLQRPTTSLSFLGIELDTVSIPRQSQPKCCN